MNKYNITVMTHMTVMLILVVLFSIFPPCAVHAHQKYDLVVSDNGIGLPEDIDISKTKSLGLQLIMTITDHQLRGTIELDRTKGTGFHIRFKEISYNKTL